MEFLCGAANNSAEFSISFLADEVNNYAPEFSSPSYEIKIPTPLPKSFDITYYLSDSKLTAFDYDLYYHNLSFSIIGTNLFQAQFDVDSSGLRPVHQVKLIATQNILQIDGDEMSFTLTAIVRAFWEL